MLFNILSSQDCTVLLATVPSGPFVILSEPICNCTSETHLLRNLVTPCRQVCVSTKVDLHTGVASQMNSKSYRISLQGLLRIQLYRPRGLQVWHTLNQTHTQCSSLIANTRKCHGRTGSKRIVTKKAFFSFLNLNNRVIPRKASSFCFNFLLLCLLCV